LDRWGFALLTELFGSSSMPVGDSVWEHWCFPRRCVCSPDAANALPWRGPDDGGVLSGAGGSRKRGRFMTVKISKGLARS